MTPTPSPPVYEFGDFSLDARKRLVTRRDGGAVALTPKVFETLLYLVEHHNTVLDKERLMEAVWPNSIVEENNLTQNISALRRVFGDSPSSHRYIVTVPGRGYRFVAEVRAREPMATPELNGMAEAAIEPPDEEREPLVPVSLPDPGISNRWSIPVLVTTAAIFVLSVAALWFWHGQTRNLLPPPPKSIAVLPFQNLSEDKGSAYLAEGIQAEILTRLSKIADLKVISQVSTQLYNSADEDLREIAKQLGVAKILKGSVQKSGDTVRVNVQLIDGASDSHLWADTFDRKSTDIFLLESDVAKAVSDQLRARRTDQEEQVITAKPTDNPEAYDAYLRGLAHTLKSVNTPANLLAAQNYLREAVKLDPKFALSWALLSYVDARGYIALTLQPTLALREEARQAAETALALQPNLGEALLAKGYYHYACLKDYDTAVSYYERARALLPNSSRIPELLVYIARRRGQWDKSESYFKEAEGLDPRNVHLLTQHAQSYIVLRRFPEAIRKLDQVLNITPDDVDTLAAKAAVAQAEGDLSRASAILAPLHPGSDDPGALEQQVYQGILERRTAPAIARLKELLANTDPALGYNNGELRFWLGWAQSVSGDDAGAQQSWTQARSEMEPLLIDQPENYLLMGDLALTDLGLGDKAAALNMAERAIAANPTGNHAPDGPLPIEIFARVAAQSGEPDRAIAALEKLLSTPYEGALANGLVGVPLTPALLRLDPMFDPLRNDPRFEKLAGVFGQ